MLKDVAEAALAWPAQLLGVVDSGLPGPKGNRSSSYTSSIATTPRCHMSSTTGSKTPSAEPVRTAAVVTHGHPEAIGEALERLERVAGKCGVELVYPEDEAEKHDRPPDGDLGAADLVVVLGGDGTMLRALKRTLGSGPPVIGVNYGAVGFLTSIGADDLELGLERAFGGEYLVAELPTIQALAGAEEHVAVNDVVVASSIIGRMIELGWRVGGEDLGVLPCDGVICSTPSGSTGYNLSNGGPVLVWGLDAQTVTFIAAHSLHARPLVVARGSDVEIENRTPDVPAQVLVDGRPVTAARRRGAGRRAARRRAHAARAPARGDLLQEVPGDLLLRRLRIENLVLIREADLEPGSGLNAITGETGAGKTILAQAIGLLLGAKGDASFVGPGAEEAYVEAEFDVPAGLLDEDELEALAELRPEDEEGLVLARRVFADGRTRAYAWGRSAAREDLAAAAERLIAMSGQFEQRRLARPSYQLDVLDAFVGEEQLRLRAELRAAWRELGAARRRHDELSGGAAAEEARLAELRALVEDTDGLTEDAEPSLLAERERLRHVTELADAAGRAVAALAPDEGEGATALIGGAERSLAEVAGIAPELEVAGG